MSATANEVIAALQQHASTSDATFLQRFFKTGEGQYGADDTFIGVRVPQTRAVCRQFKDLPLNEIQKLLDSRIHEHRLAAVILLADQYVKANEPMQKQIYELYLKNVRHNRVNNWDLVDSSAEFIVGPWLADKSKDILFDLAATDSIWCRRVGIMAAFDYIKKGDATVTIELAEVLLQDKQDLIQKAVGWQLREVGKRVDKRLLLDFLDKHAHDMPRTTLRYALEHLSVEQKAHYMKAISRKNT
ncbi:MAG TPA: DNA alkylation repair protein [Patescibacteria group bacterium]|nr:DNA alkylation repair protein [Patescibacteria group bacterium]